jgi:N-acetylglucosamine kinase-like BadF-type ATPase
VHDVLAELWPEAEIGVVADYHAAHRAAGSDICVIAGTGSVVCSRDADGRWVLDGGRGWILGDHGSSARLGQELLAWYVDQPDSVPASAASALCEILGTTDWRGVVSRVHSSSAPAATLGAVAPVLTALAEAGNERAVRIVEGQLSELARTTIRHASRRQATKPLTVGLVGGVWASPAAVAVFERALARRADLVQLVEAPVADPLDGALALVQIEAA